MADAAGHWLAARQSGCVCVDSVAGEFFLDRRGDEVAEVAAASIGDVLPEAICELECDAGIQRRRVRACPTVVQGDPQIMITSQTKRARLGSEERTEPRPRTPPAKKTQFVSPLC
jgi:hypothetical protein